MTEEKDEFHEELKKRVVELKKNLLYTVKESWTDDAILAQKIKFEHLEGVRSAVEKRFNILRRPGTDSWSRRILDEKVFEYQKNLKNFKFSYQKPFLGMIVIEKAIEKILPILKNLDSYAKQTLGDDLEYISSKIEIIETNLTEITNAQQRIVNSFFHIFQVINRKKVEEKDLKKAIKTYNKSLEMPSGVLIDSAMIVRAETRGSRENWEKLDEEKVEARKFLENFNFVFQFCWSLATLSQGNLRRVENLDLERLKKVIKSKHEVRSKILEDWSVVCKDHKNYLTLGEALDSFTESKKYYRYYKDQFPLHLIAAKMEQKYFDELCKVAIEDNGLGEWPKGLYVLASRLSEAAKEALNLKVENWENPRKPKLLFSEFWKNANPSYLTLYLLSLIIDKDGYRIEDIDKKISDAVIYNSMDAKVRMLKLMYKSKIGFTMNELASFLGIPRGDVNTILTAHSLGRNTNIFFESMRYRGLKFYTIRGWPEKINKRIGPARKRNFPVKKKDKIKSDDERNFYV